MNLAKTLRKKGTARKDKKFYIIYPEYDWKNKWNLLIGLILIVSCAVTPM